MSCLKSRAAGLTSTPPPRTNNFDVTVCEMPRKSFSTTSIHKTQGKTRNYLRLVSNEFEVNAVAKSVERGWASQHSNPHKHHLAFCHHFMCVKCEKSSVGERAHVQTESTTLCQLIFNYKSSHVHIYQTNTKSLAVSYISYI